MFRPMVIRMAGSLGRRNHRLQDALTQGGMHKDVCYGENIMILFCTKYLDIYILMILES